MNTAEQLVRQLLDRCTFPPTGTTVNCAFSGGADSTTLVVLAQRAGCAVTAIHVDHGLRPSSVAEADRAAQLAGRLGVAFERREIHVEAGPNLEARARTARHGALPSGTLTGHTADDQAETVLINLLRGAGAGGLAGITPGPTKPLLALRRHETVELCAVLGLDVVTDPTNTDRRFVRNRVRNEVLPLLDAVAGRDVVELVVRTASVLRDDDELLDRLAANLDPTDAKALTVAEPALARRALRRFLAEGGYPPDLATLNRALDVARGRHRACELGGGRRLERHQQRLEIVPPTDATPRESGHAGR